MTDEAPMAEVASLLPAIVETPPPSPGPVEQFERLLDERPEMVAGAALLAGLILARMLRRLAS